MRSLVLGCAQFGNGYGFYIKTPQLGTETIDEILRLSLKNGVTELDLAQNYVGVVSNLAEQETLKDFQLGTKVEYSPNREAEITRKLHSEINELGVVAFESILIHNWAQLNSFDRKQALSFLGGLKRQGVTKHIGISIYETTELENIDSELDIVQAPLSYFNTDFLRSEEVVTLKRHRVTFVARSIFHQGTLLNPNVLPKIFDKEKEDYESFCNKNKLSYLQAALSVFDAQSIFTKLVVGVSNSEQLSEIIDCRTEFESTLVAEIPSCAPRELVDPRKWGKT
jgi:aryl-alcohol dehydrogenase-like predicted oxidoreductase